MTKKSHICNKCGGDGYVVGGGHTNIGAEAEIFSDDGVDVGDEGGGGEGVGEGTGGGGVGGHCKVKGGEGL